MATYQGDVLEVLKSELTFLESGGYKWCMQKPWRAPLVFVESRTCPKHAVGASNCESCALMQFVPAEARGGDVPCWHIPLDEASETLESLYRWGTEDEVNQSLQTWLLSTIMSIEEDRRAEAIALRRQGQTKHCDAPGSCSCGSK